MDRCLLSEYMMYRVLIFCLHFFASNSYTIPRKWGTPYGLMRENANFRKLITPIFSRNKDVSITPCSLKPRNENQKRYLEALENKNISICVGIGPAGTGKTLFGCHSAIHGFQTGKYKRIVFTRPTVSVEDEQLGFLPGSIQKKMDPWVRPIMDTFSEHYTQKGIDTMMANGVLEISPLGFMRGRTFKDTIIVADEIQNTTPMQMLMLTTRLGVGSKLIITGDLEQSDIGRDNGLHDFLGRIQISGGVEGISVIEFDQEDVERSEIVKRVLSLYNR